MARYRISRGTQRTATGRKIKEYRVLKSGKAILGGYETKEEALSAKFRRIAQDKHARH